MKTLKLILFLACITAKSFAQDTDRWYILSFGDKPAGFYHELSRDTIINAKTLIISESSFKMALSRLGSVVNITSTARQAETAGGKLRNVVSESLLSQQSSVIRAEISDSVVYVTTSTAGHDISQVVRYTGSLTGNEKLRMLTIKNLMQAGDSVVYQTYFPDFNMVVTGIRKFVGKEDIEAAGRIISAIKVADSFKGLPVNRQLWLDKSGRLLKSSEPNPYGQMTLVLSNKKTAVAAASQKVDISEDQYANTVARSNVRLPQARQMQSVTLKIKLKNPEGGFPDFSGAYQEVLKKGKDYVVLKITRPKPVDRAEPSFEKNKQQFLASNSFLNKDDTMIINAANQIIGSETDPWKKVLLIRNWVNNNMKFNPGIVMASSSEVIRNMEGTCISFATVTTTLCRAAGIPARFLMGYVYTDGMWGGHAWTEVNINNTWLPIDAALICPSLVADAARFYYVRSSMANGPGETFIGGEQLYSNVDISILAYTVNDETETTEKDPYYVTDSLYNNPGLKLSMKKLDGFTFTETGKVYPENILFNLENKNTGESIKLYEYRHGQGNDLKKEISDCLNDQGIKAVPTEASFNGSRVFKATVGEQSGVAVINGSDIYLVVANGKAPAHLLVRGLQALHYKKFPDVSFQ